MHHAQMQTWVMHKCRVAGWLPGWLPLGHTLVNVCEMHITQSHTVPKTRPVVKQQGFDWLQWPLGCNITQTHPTTHPSPIAEDQLKSVHCNCLTHQAAFEYLLLPPRSAPTARTLGCNTNAAPSDTFAPIPISDDPFARQNRFGLHQGFPWFHPVQA